jgi:hypothetical protein
MFDVQPLEMVDEKGFTVVGPCKIEALLGSVARGAIAKGVDDVEGACEAEGLIEERAP